MRQSIVVLDRRRGPRACGTGSLMLKRIIGLPQEAVAQRHGVIYIDGKELVEPYADSDGALRSDFADVHLGRNAYFVMGDNRDVSCDSREFGPVDRSEILGMVVAGRG
jgi:signal peptidase I